MTAEVAVMNRLAVALAADSAVTIQNEQETKIFQTENKLFELSETKPIGLMIYQSTTFFGIPWEIIVKDFRKEHGQDAAETVFDWVPIFTKFLLTNFKPSEEQQHQFVLEILTEGFARIVSLFQQEAFHVVVSDATREQKGEAFQKHFNHVLDSQLARHDSWHDEGYDDISVKEAADWLKHHEAAYKQAYKAILSDLPLERKENAKVRRLARCMLKSTAPTDYMTGLVFAGFGDKEIFPSLQCIEVFGVIADKLKVHEQEKIDIDRKTDTGAVVPFAQRDTADSLMFGRSLDYEMTIVEHFQNLMNEVGFAVVEEAIEDDAKRNDFKERVGRATEAAIERFFNEIAPELHHQFSSDILDIIRAMPKQELASFAEALVNVTSIKRKVSVGPETVGGPVDVAVISRHEGFVWVKRKLYFPPELNPRYRWRAFGRKGDTDHAP